MNKQKTTYKYILKYSDFASHKAYIGRAFSTCGKIGNDIVMYCINDDGGSGLVICVSEDEFVKYFDIIKDDNTKNTHRCVASKKKNGYEYGHYTKDNKTYAYKTDGKRIVVRRKGIKAESKCLASDKFDFEYGINLAILRHKIKYYNNLIEKYKKEVAAMIK